MTDGINVPIEARQKYLDRRKQDVIACQEALTKKDFHFLEKIGHQIKGNAITFGFDEFTNIAIDLEAAAKSKDFNQLNVLVDRLTTAVNKAQI